MGGGMSSVSNWNGSNQETLTRDRNFFNSYDGSSWDNVFDPTTKDPMNGLFQFLDSSGNLVPVPQEILEKVFSYCSVDDIPNIALVCSKWKNITSGQVFWTEMMKKYDVGDIEIPDNVRAKSNGWIVMRAACKGLLSRNFIVNPCGQDGLLVGWRRDHESRTEMIVEIPPVGSPPLEPDNYFGDIVSCFATSYDFDSLYQVISFRELGLTRALIELMSPFVIRIEFMISSRHDCGGRGNYDLCFFKDGQLAHDIREPLRMEAGEPWKKIDDGYLVDPHLFLEPFDTTFKFAFSGKDLRFWAGHYGLKFTRFKCTLKLIDRSKIENLGNNYIIRRVQFGKNGEILCPG